MERKKIVKRKLIITLVILLFIVFSFISFSLLISEKVFQTAETIAELAVKYFGTDKDEDPGFINDMINMRIDKYYRVVDNLNIFRGKRNLFDGGLPIYDLKLSQNDIGFFKNTSKKFVDQGYKDDASNRWRTAELYMGKEKYDVEVKFHGDSTLHWANNLRSYRVKTSPDIYINQTRVFNLILFEDRLFSAKITRVLSKRLGLYDIRDDIVALRINGVRQGPYYLQEHLDLDLLENNECSNCAIFALKDNSLVDHLDNQNGVYLGVTWHITEFDYEISKMAPPITQLDEKKIFYPLNELLGVIEEGNADKLTGYFDLDQLSSFEALRKILGSSNMVVGDNLRLVYSASTGKFYPLPINENIFKLRLAKGSFEHNVNSYGGEQIKLFYLLNQNDEFRQLTYRKLYNFIINDGEDFLKEIDSLNDKYLPYIYSYKPNLWSHEYIKFKLKNQRKIVSDNMELIKDNLEYSKAYINAIVKNNKITLEVLPDSISPIRMTKLTAVLDKNYNRRLQIIYEDEDGFSSTQSAYIDSSDTIDLTQLVSSFSFSAGFDEELYPRKRTYLLTIIFEDAETIGVSSLQVNLKNDISNKPLLPNEININIADGNSFYDDSKYLSFQEFNLRYPHLSWSYDNGNLTLRKGDYIISSDLIVPKFKNLKIEEGTRIRIAGNQSILSYSPVQIGGTFSSPVVIEALSPEQPFGTFAVVGEPGDGCAINWLDLSGGSERFLNGIYFSGAMSIHSCDVVMNNSKIHHNNADDGINIRYSNVNLDRNSFYNNRVDQVDLDFGSGIVKNTQFIGTPPIKNEPFLIESDMKNNPYKGALDYGAIDGKIFGKTDNKSSLIFSNNGDGLDLSGSRVLIWGNTFSNMGDKGVSVGEKTDAILFKNYLSSNNVSVAVKDFSNAFFIDNTFRNNIIVFAVYEKKPLFGGGYAYIFENTYKSNEALYFVDKKSKIYNISVSDKENSDLIRHINKGDIEASFNFLDEYKQGAK